MIHNFILIVLLDGVNDVDVIHHDDDPGTAADDEDDGNHDQNYG